jgi:hypothetical protein
VSPLALAARLVILTAVSCKSADYVTLLFQRSTNTTFNNVAIAIERTSSNFLCRAIFLAATVHTETSLTATCQFFMKNAYFFLAHMAE